MPSTPTLRCSVRVFGVGLVVAAGLAGSVSPAQAASGCTKVASPSGSDSASGSEAAPFRSAQKLADSLASGQTGCLRAGTYTDSAFSVVAPHTDNITLRSYPGERAKLSGQIEIANADGFTLSGVNLEGTGNYGSNTLRIYSANTVIENNDITNNWHGRSCLILGNNSGGGQAVRPTIRRNRFHECGSSANGDHDHAIYAANTVDAEITDNLFYNSAAFTIQLYPNSQRTHFAHNVVDGGPPASLGGIVISGDDQYASSNNIVENNVIANASDYNVTNYWESRVGTGNIVRNNCVWNGQKGNIRTPNGYTATNNTVANPQFANPTTRNYTIPNTNRCAKLIRVRTAGVQRAGAKRARHVRVRFRLRKYRSSRVFNRFRRIRLSLRVRGGSLHNARFWLAAPGNKVFASRRVKHLTGAKRIRIPKRRSVRAGTYVLLLTATDGAGRPVSKAARVRFRR